jgi:hypothetical protein
MQEHIIYDFFGGKKKRNISQKESIPEVSQSLAMGSVVNPNDLITAKWWKCVVGGISIAKISISTNYNYNIKIICNML